MESETDDVLVEAAALRPALRRLKELGGKTPGPGIWRASAGALEVEWKGGTEGMEASGAREWAIRIDAKHMVLLARTLAKSGTVSIRLRDEGRVSFGSYVVGYERVAPLSTDLLTVHATPYDVLMLGYRHRPGEVRNAGLEPDLEEARAKLARSVAHAAGALAWAGVDEGLLARWVDAHLGAVAGGEPSFEIVGPADPQLGLFD